MSTDSNGFNSFFHCLIFYEEINEAELAYDFDYVTDVLKKNSKHRNQNSNTSNPNSKNHKRQSNPDEDDFQ